MCLEAAASGRSLNIIWRELKTTYTASQLVLSLSFHIYSGQFSAKLVEICFSPLSSQASKMVSNLTANLTSFHYCHYIDNAEFDNWKQADFDNWKQVFFTTLRYFTI